MATTMYDKNKHQLLGVVIYGYIVSIMLCPHY